MIMEIIMEIIDKMLSRHTQYPFNVQAKSPVGGWNRK